MTTEGGLAVSAWGRLSVVDVPASVLEWHLADVDSLILGAKAESGKA